MWNTEHWLKRPTIPPHPQRWSAAGPEVPGMKVAAAEKAAEAVAVKEPGAAAAVVAAAVEG